MKRPKSDTLYWLNRIDRLFEVAPEMKSVKNRYKTLKTLIQERYPQIKDMPNAESFLKDIVYLDRKVRWVTEGEEAQTKKILSQEFIVNEL